MLGFQRHIRWAETSLKAQKHTANSFCYKHQSAKQSKAIRPVRHRWWPRPTPSGYKTNCTYWHSVHKRPAHQQPTARNAGIVTHGPREGVEHVARCGMSLLEPVAYYSKRVWSVLVRVGMRQVILNLGGLVLALLHVVFGYHQIAAEKAHGYQVCCQHLASVRRRLPAAGDVSAERLKRMISSSKQYLACAWSGQ